LMISALIYVLSACVVMGGFAGLAFLHHDPVWINRGGALLTALAAAFAVYEAFFEERAKHQLESTKIASKRPEGWTVFSPRARLAERIRTIRWRERQTSLSSRKLKLIFLSSIIAVCGEIIQGFGDLIYTASLNWFGAEELHTFFGNLSSGVYGIFENVVRAWAS